MSCGLDVGLDPLKAFLPFLMGMDVLLGPGSSVGFVRYKSRVGHGLGQPIKR